MPKGQDERIQALKTPAKRAAAKRSPAAKTSTPAKTRSKAKPAPNPVLDAVLACLEDGKAEEIVAIQLDPKAALADQMVIATGRSNRHVAAIADQLVDKLKAEGLKDMRIEGLPQADWVLVDAGPVIVHLFRPEVRSFYNLEKLWSPHAPDEQLAV